MAVHEFCQATRRECNFPLSWIPFVRVSSPVFVSSLVKREPTKGSVRIWEPAVNLVESCLFCALTLPRSATSASVKIDAYARAYNHNCRTSFVRMYTYVRIYARSDYTHIETDRPLSLISDPRRTLTKFNVRNRNFIAIIFE